MYASLSGESATRTEKENRSDSATTPARVPTFILTARTSPSSFSGTFCRTISIMFCAIESSCMSYSRRFLHEPTLGKGKKHANRQSAKQRESAIRILISKNFSDHFYQFCQRMLNHRTGAVFRSDGVAGGGESLLLEPVTVELLEAFRAEAVSESGFRSLGDVFLYDMPLIVGCPNPVA